MNASSPNDLDENQHMHPSAERNDEKPFTVLQVVPALNSGGVERGTLEISQAIINAGGRAIVVTSGGRMERYFNRIGADVIILPVASKKPLTIKANIKRLMKVIQAEKVDLVHARSRAPAWSAYFAAKKMNVPFVTTYHGVYNEGFLGKKFYNSVMAKGDEVIAVSEHVADHILKRHKINPEKLTVIPRGADLANFSEEAVGNQRMVQLAEQWGILDDPRPVIMLPGRLTRWKGQEHFLDAVAILKDVRGTSDFLAILVGGDEGDGKFARALEQRAISMSLNDCVRLVGHTDDMPSAYRLASYVVSSSIEPEAFGRVSVEAQAMSRPVIATNHGGSCETIAEGLTGWLYPPEDTRVLARILNDALNLDETHRSHMGSAARTRVSAQFSTEQMQRKTLDIYENLSGLNFPNR